MNQTEREICARLKLARESLRWPQSEFAQALGITRAQLAAIEAAKTPLRYSIAWKAGLEFSISVRWLGTSIGVADTTDYDGLPEPSETGLKPRALLSQVIERFPDYLPTPKTPEHLHNLQKDEADDLISQERILKLVIETWLTVIPEGQGANFRDALVKAARDFVDRTGRRDPESEYETTDRMMWERLRRDIAEKFIQAGKHKKTLLTDAATSGKKLPVKPLLPNLLSRLRTATEQPGKKSELAKYLGAPLASVSRWLAGDREPGAEITLKLLHWVEQQER